MAKPTAASTPSKIEILDGKLHIFRRKDTRNWWCGYHHKGIYHRTSTKQADLTDAIEAAKQWYYIQQYQIANGQAPNVTKTNKDTYAYYAKLAIQEYDRMAKNGERSPKYAAQLRHLITNHLIPFFGTYKISALNQSVWNEYVETVLRPRNVKQLTIKQHLNGLRVVFRRTIMRGDTIAPPVFYTERKTSAQATPRTWFNEQEQIKLFTALHQNIKDKKGTRWEYAALELYDYVAFMINTGLRVDEGKNLRFKDVTKKKETDEHGVLKPFLYLDPVRGKRGTGSCKTLFGAVQPFERIVKRRKLEEDWQNSEEPIFLAHHRDMFNTVLKACKLKHTTHKPPLRRDLMSLRNTYICQRILAGVSETEIAITCRTSLPMIHSNYARWLKPSEVNINRSRPPSDAQLQEQNKKTLEQHMKTVMPQFTAALEEVEEELMAKGQLRGSGPTKRSHRDKS